MNRLEMVGDSHAQVCLILLKQSKRESSYKIKLTIIRYIPMPKCASKLIMKSEREWKLKTLKIIKVFPNMHL